MFSSILALALIPQALAAPGFVQHNTASRNTTREGPSNTTDVPVASGTTAPLGGSGAWAYHSPAWLPSGNALASQHYGWNSPLGTLNASRLPPYRSDSPMPQGYPWGNSRNPYTDLPNTGVTRHYEFTLAPATIAPDGVERPGYLINGQFPAPTIEANWGDWFEIIVHNNLPEGTSMHWHGLLQKDTPWFDGVPSVTQCPIAPGSSFTYRFRADQYGTSWYHSHYSAQYADGLFGAMIIYGPLENANYDVDLGPILINDWYHDDYHNLIGREMAPISAHARPPFSQNVLINGKMNYPCANVTSGAKCTPNAGVSKFQFKSGKKYRLRLINSGAAAMQKFSIDNHNMTVIATDYIPVVPYVTNVITLGVGQRADVVVTANGKPTDAVWMRSELGPSAFVKGCSLPDGISPTGVAAIYYESANTTAVPQTNSSTTLQQLMTCENDPLTLGVPFFPYTPTAQPDTVQQIDVTFKNNGTHNLFYMDNSTFRGDFNDPVLLDAKLGNLDFPAHYNVYNFGNSTSIRFVVYNHAPAGSHPMHMHGHDFSVLATGSGTWDGTVTNPLNPVRRDVFILPIAVSPTVPSYVVFQIEADNPGTWPFHCHIAWHISTGLYINILERPADIQKDMAIPSIMAQTCRDWWAWTGNNVVDQIDSGL